MADVRETLVGHYATLALSATDQGVSVQGAFPVVHEGDVLDRYEIEITFPATYPDDPPSVRETAGRIPRIADRHNSSGVACLFVPLEWKLRRPDTRFETFLLGPVHSYFVGQSLVEAGQPWLFGERKHGVDGALEALRDMLGLTTTNRRRQLCSCSQKRRSRAIGTVPATAACDFAIATGKRYGA